MQDFISHIKNQKMIDKFKLALHYLEQWDIIAGYLPSIPDSGAVAPYADGWVAAGSLLGYAICCGKHAGVDDCLGRWRGAENLEECLLVFAGVRVQSEIRFRSRKPAALNELFALLRYERYVSGREEDIFSV
jgi:hypothetical protein